MKPGQHPNSRKGTDAVRANARAAASESFARKRREKVQNEAKKKRAYPEFPGTTSDLLAHQQRLRQDFYVREAQRRAA